GGPRLEVALHVEPAEQSGEVECGPTPALPGAAGAARAERLLEIDERHARVLRNPAARRSAAAAADLPGLDEHDLDAGDGERIRRRTAGQPAADDHDVALLRAALPRKHRHARFRKAIDPGRAVVVGHSPFAVRGSWFVVRGKTSTGGQETRRKRRFSLEK